MITRKQFGAMVAAGLGAGITARSDVVLAQANTPQASNLPTTPSAPGQATYFFNNSAFEFALLTSLGRTYHQGANIGNDPVKLVVFDQVEKGQSNVVLRK